MRRILRSLYCALASLLVGTGVTRLHIIRRIDDYVRNLIKSKTVYIGKHIIFLDDLDSLGLSIFGHYEPYQTSLIRQIVKPGNTVLDVGAHIGYYSLIIADRITEAGTLLAFEPDPTNFSLLRKNLSVNNIRNVEAINKALSDETAEVDFFVSEKNRGDNRLYSAEPDFTKTHVAAVDLDSFLAERELKIDFIKMDIQGAELKALRGMQSTLASLTDIEIIFEFWPFGLCSCGENPEELLAFVETLGFRIAEVHEGSKAVRELNLPQLLKTYTVANKKHTNLLCTKGETMHLGQC